MGPSDVNAGSIEELAAVFDTYIGQTSTGEMASLDCGRIRVLLDKIFDGKTCSSVTYTTNTDKLFFGCMVNPSIMADDLLDILFGDGEFIINRYALEIDSKMFDIGMTGTEISAYILYEISALVTSSAPAWEVRGLIDEHMAEEDDVIDIKASVNFSQILIFAIKDALIKVSSVMYKDTDGILANDFINSNDLRDPLVSGLDKIRSSVFGIGTAVKEPKLILLSWAFGIYKEARLRAVEARNTLVESKKLTASKLWSQEIDKTIKSIERLDLDVANEAARIIQESKGKGGIFASLKKSGLRSLEDDLYEFAVRVKNAESEDDVYYCLRQINTRLNILEEYIYDNDTISDREKEKWLRVAREYRDLREQLSKKKFSKKNYGLWYDYDKLDDLDSDG